MEVRFVAVSGNIGVGKSSLVRFLTEQYGFLPIYEPVDDNPYLSDFYADMGRWSFHSQTFFLARKFRLHLDIEAHPARCVLDRTIYEDAEIFAAHLAQSGHLSERDHRTYLELYSAMRRSLAPPDLLIHLRCSVRAIRKRIQRRNRAAEQGISASYLRQLNRLYDDWIRGWSDSPLVVWDSEGLDYLEDLVDQIEFHRALEPFL